MHEAKTQLQGAGKRFGRAARWMMEEIRFKFSVTLLISANLAPSRVDGASILRLRGSVRRCNKATDPPRRVPRRPPVAVPTSKSHHRGLVIIQPFATTTLVTRSSDINKSCEGRSEKKRCGTLVCSKSGKLFKMSIVRRCTRYYVMARERVYSI